MRLYYFVIGVAVVTMVCAFMGHAIAQSAPFSISGQVTDANGNPVTGANVTLVDNNFDALGTRTTGQNGSYDFLNVVSNTNTVTLTVSYTKDGVTYTVPSYYIRWYPAQGVQVVPSSETQIPGYPPSASATAEPTNTASALSGLAVEPFIAAVAIGIICLAGVYFLLYKKS